MSHKNPYDGMTNPYAGYGYGMDQQGYNPYQGYAPMQQQFGFPTQQQVPGLFTPGAPGVQPTLGADVPGMLPLEQSYIENILRLNKGKLATVYMNFNGSRESFVGIVEAAGRDHIILSDPQTGMRYLLLMVYLEYVTFDEELEYDYPFGVGIPGATTYPPR
ncbi:spore coat protein GerQ [Cytobacillus luteolus]|nr:spore coat protein GerQ [Cytobacillus luteolus]MBP1944058.1 spore germination protein Q [Cytobacillus luteolus]